MTFKEFWENSLIENIPSPEGWVEKDAAEAAWKAAMKEAAKICREQKGSIATTNNEQWNEACEYCAVEIEQS